MVGGTDYGESDRVVHLLTREGRLSAFAPGARRSKRRFSGALEPFATIRAGLRASRKHGMPLLTSSEVVRARLGIRESLERIALASVIAELGSKVAPEGDASGGLYLAVEAALDRVAEGAHPGTLSSAFELRVISELGYAPLLDGCVVCGGPAEGPSILDLGRGGLLCGAHRGGGIEIGPKTLEWMRRILAEREGLHEDAGLDAEWAATAALKLGRVLREFLEGMLGRPLRSAGVLDELEGPGQGGQRS